MSSVSLYRKYRPQSFDEILEQDHIVKVLEAEIKNQSISHAYLFSGSRGIGKTSVARIFAKELGVSESDIYEIDAASNRRVEEVKSILEGVHTYPYSSKYKIYIMDEVHMLSTEAWNSFLKTLEEPPAHCIFILATTELHKVLDTVVSRCEHFLFRKPTANAIADAVMRVAREEGVDLARETASIIALLADGSFRDALSTLQKIVNLSRDRTLSADEAATVLGSPKLDIIISIIEAIGSGEAATALEHTRALRAEGSDVKITIALLTEYVRLVLLLRFAPHMKSAISNDVSESHLQQLESLAKTSKQLNSRIILALLDASTRVNYLSDPSLSLELAIMEVVPRA